MEKPTIITVDCEYGGPEMAAAYVLIDSGRAAFIDNNTARAVPILLKALGDAGLGPEAVDYLIVTHVHLDHAGGTSELLKACPDARVLCHASAQPHLVNPARLVQSARQVYGEPVFTQLYGTIEPIARDRVHVMEHGSTLAFGNSTLHFLETPGHARHHLTIVEQTTRSAFTGDAFGLCYPWLPEGKKPFVMASTPPTDFDAALARNSVENILETGPRRLCLTHFGVIDDVSGAAEVMLRSLDDMETVQVDAMNADVSEDELLQYCQDRVREKMLALAEWCGVALEAPHRAAIEKDILINGQGIAHRVTRDRRKAESR